MGKQGRSNKLQQNKQPSIVRTLILIGGLLLLSAGAVLWLLSNAQKIDSSWFNILAILFGVLGVFLTFVFWIFPFPTHQFEADPTDQISPSPNAQQLSLQKAQQAQQIQHVQNLQQFFLSQGSPFSQQTAPVENVLRSDTPEAESAQITIKRTLENNTNAAKETSIQAEKPTEYDGEESLPDPDVIFQINVRMPNPTEFYGRANIQATLVSRTRKRASTSIVGPRRIGKTWLMRYFLQVAPQNLGSNFLVGYLDATWPSCATVSGFTSRAIKELGNA